MSINNDLINFKNILYYFELNVENNPENIALIYNNINFTYREVYEKSNQYARFFLSLGTLRNSIVAIDVNRSPLMIFIIFGIIKAGAAYSPIPINDPINRKKNILINSNAKVLITDKDYSFDFIDTYLSTDINIESFSSKSLENINFPTDTAYVIYTSGSTGTPKGVMISHLALINRIFWMQDEFPLGSNDIVFNKTSYSFDVSVWEIFWWSISGSKLLLLPSGCEFDIKKISDSIIKNNVSVIHFVPSVFDIFLNYLEIPKIAKQLNSLRYIFCSGERLSSFTANKFISLFSRKETELINLYGPTESTIDVSFFRINKSKTYKNVPIGYPIKNTDLYILDNNLNVCDLNVKGEICISGISLSHGYLNETTLTNNNFIVSTPLNKTIYKTGDIGYFDSDEVLHYVGRKDSQFKINGIRIDPSEIENCVKDFNSEIIPIVSFFDDLPKKLILFIFSSDNQVTNKNLLQKFLISKLPSYMMPNELVFIDSIPINSNGKRDIKKIRSDYLSSLNCKD